uniref:Putative spotted leaf protein 11 n=1 Tax=Phyllostachys edulis TaxID=38705 RepID=D3IVL3_PHYED|nr:putative spotted leaf protein 11 [Phyllostachys edulis]
MAGDREEGEPPLPAEAPASERVAAAVEAVAAAGEYRNAFRRQLLALSRRIRLLGPFAEELRERRAPAPEEEERALAPLADALEKALELLRLGREGSRIFLVSELFNPMLG